jgi:hypothetical protein
MNALVINKISDSLFSLVLNGGDAIISEQNRLTTKGNLCNFKTANGANLILKQNILVSEITLNSGGTFTFVTVASLWSKLIEVGFFNGVAITSGSVTVFDEFTKLTDTFTSYLGRDGQILVVNESSQKIESITIALFTDAEKTKLEGIETGAQVNVQANLLQNDPLEDDFVIGKEILNSVVTSVTDILSSALATQTSAGMATWINANSFAVATNEIRQFHVTDTGQVFELLLRGRSFGSATPAISYIDVLDYGALGDENWSKTGDNIRNTNTAFVKIGADYSFGFNTKLSVNKGADAIGIATNGSVVAVDGFRFADQSSGYYKNDNDQVFINYGNTGADDWRFSPVYNLGSGSQSKSTIIIDPTLSANTGTATVNLLRLKPTINQTGSATGITRSLLIDAILTAAADYRAIEVINGKVIFPAGVGGNEAVVMSQISNVMRNVVKDVVPSSAVTGTLTETILKSYLITANTFASSDNLSIPNFGISKVGVANTVSIKIYMNTSNSLSGATQIAVFNLASANTYAKITRSFLLDSGTIKGLGFATSSITDITTANNGLASASFNPAINNYIITTVTLANTADSVTQTSFIITN